MGLPAVLISKFVAVFFQDINNKTAVRTSATGEFSQTGLKNAGKVTEVELISTAWRKLPGVAQTDRNAMAIVNKTGIQMKVNYQASGGDINADITGYVGIPIEDQEERDYNIKDTIEIYGKSQTGTIIVFVEELS